MTFRLVMILLLGATGVVSRLPAANSPVDSLWQVVQSLPETDTAHIMSLHRIARYYVYDSTRLAIRLLEESLQKSRKTDFSYGEIVMHEKLGVAYDVLGKLDSAIYYYDAGMELLRQNPDVPYDSMYFMINKGVAYFYGGELGKALEYYLVAEQEALRLKADSELSYLLNNQGVVYRLLGKYEDAIRVYERSLVMKQAAGDIRGMANTELNIGNALIYLGQPDAGIPHIQTSRALYLQIQDTAEARSTDLTLGIGYYHMGDLARARELLESCLKASLSQQNDSGLAEGSIVLAQIYLEESRHSEAFAALQQARGFLAGTDWDQLRIRMYKGWSDYWQTKGVADSALVYLTRYHDLFEELNSQERQKLEEEMEARYAVREINNQVRLQKLELERVQRQRWLLVVGLGGAVIVVLLLYWLYRTRQKANLLLEQKNQTIRLALNEKEVLLREIHHRVKNNLQVVSSLLSLQSRQIEDPQALAVMKEGRNRVKSMALIHQNLYQDENLVGVDVREYLDKLTRSLQQSYAIDPGKVELDLEVDAIKLDVDVIIPLGLILNELISNALKYAFPANQTGKLSVHLLQRQDGLELKVVDDGVGLPQDVDVRSKGSLGLYLVDSFAKKLDATFELFSDNGTVARLMIPSASLT